MMRIAAARGCSATLAAASVMGPLCLGSSGSWSRLALEGVMAATAVVWASSGRRTAATLALPLAIAGLAMIQLLPLPDRILMSLSPFSGAAWKIAMAGASDGQGMISIDPGATAAGIRRMLLGLAAMVAVADLARSAEARRTLFGGLAISGVVMWVLGVAFPVTHEDRTLLGFIDIRGPIDYWLTPLEPPVRTCGVGERTEVAAGDYRYTAIDSRVGDGFGPYIYSNHFAGGMCLTVPAILGWMLVLARGRMPEWSRCLPAAAIAVAAIWTSARLAGSRAGGASLAYGTLVFFTLVVRGAWPRRILGTAAIACTVALLGFVLVFFGPLRGVENMLPVRMRPGFHAILADPRVAETAVAMRIFRSSPWLGTGLNTYGELNAALNPGRFVSYYAHNDYAQLLAEAGIVGGLVAAGMGIALLERFRRFLRPPAVADLELTAGAWAALAGLGVHSFFDWNLHLPANAFLAVLASGVALASGGSTAVPSHAVARFAAVLGRASAWGLGVSCVMAFALLARDAMTEQTQRQLRSAITADRIWSRTREDRASGADLERAIAAGERMAGWDPSCARLASLLSQAHVHAAGVCADGACKSAAERNALAWSERTLSLAPKSLGLPEQRQPPSPGSPEVRP